MTLGPAIICAFVLGLAGAALGGAAGFWAGAILGVLLGLVWGATKRVQGAPPDNSGVQMPQPPVYFESLPTRTPQYSKPRTGPLRWVPAGEEVNVAGFRIVSGLIYTCDGEPEPDEPSAINTRLPVDVPARGTQAALGYYCQYRFLSAAQRGAYLEWLTAGRKDEDPEKRDLGYVFLFLYGIERRLLIDGGQDPEAVRELVFLLNRYTLTHSLRRYICQLIHFWGWRQGVDYYAQLCDWMDTLPVSLLGEDEMAIVLASLHLSGKPLPPNLAYDLAFRHPEARHTVVVRRSERELKELFTKRYLEQFPGGMTLMAASTGTQVDYRPASPNLLELSSRQPEYFRLQIPNVMGISTQFQPLLSIWQSCIDDLASYSRVKAKEGADASLKAHLALPEELRARTPHPLTAHWEAVLQKARREHACVLISAAEPAEMLGIPKRPKLTPTQSRQVAEVIESFGCAVEPDARYSKIGYLWDQELAVFLPRKGRVVRPTGNCRGAQMLLELCVFVAAADGHVSPEELEVARKSIDSQISLSPEDVERLDAFQEVLIGDPGKARASFPKIARGVPVKERERIGHLLVLIAAADNLITKDELRALEQAFSAFGLATERLEQFLRSIRPESQEVTVQEPGQKVSGEAIPPPSAFKLDMSRVAAIAQETTEVIGILSQVMAEEDELPQANENVSPVPVSPPKSTESPTTTATAPVWMAALDSKYQPLLQRLIDRDSWSRRDFDSLAKSFRLMPLDAYDSLNEWSDEHLGDFLLDGDDPVLINRSLIPKGEPTNA